MCVWGGVFRSKWRIKFHKLVGLKRYSLAKYYCYQPWGCMSAGKHLHPFPKQNSQVLKTSCQVAFSDKLTYRNTRNSSTFLHISNKARFLGCRLLLMYSLFPLFSTWCIFLLVSTFSHYTQPWKVLLKHCSLRSYGGSYCLGGRVLSYQCRVM